jgi:hypothetical protein
MDQSSFFSNDGYNQEQDVKSFIKKFSDYSPADLTDIIKKYINYDSAAVSAALFLCVDRGYVSYDLKELLWNQIVTNFVAISKSRVNYSWESHNAFIEYFKHYSDEDIYSLIESPDGIVADVFHAILTVARNRELISEEDFDSNYEDAKSDEGFKVERKTGVLGKLFSATESEAESDVMSEDEIAAEQAKFWKCPECSQLVDMELAVCWNCQAGMPEVPEHPGREAVLVEQEQQKVWTPVRSGFYMITAGATIILLNYLRDFSFFQRRKFEVILGAFFALVGTFFVIYGLFFNKGSDNFMDKRTRN